jgi:putative transposase
MGHLPTLGQILTSNQKKTNKIEPKGSILYKIETHIKEQIPILCQQYGWEQLALEVMPEHIHLFVSAPPATAPVTIASTLKSILAVSVFKTFPTLKQKKFWGSGLWSDGTYYGSAGTVSAETIKKYIENQKDK